MLRLDEKGFGLVDRPRRLEDSRLIPVPVTVKLMVSAATATLVEGCHYELVSSHLSKQIVQVCVLETCTKSVKVPINRRDVYNPISDRWTALEAIHYPT